MNAMTNIIRFQPKHEEFDEDEGEWYPVDEFGRVYRYIWDDVENDDRQDLIRINISNAKVSPPVRSGYVKTWRR
jgi:hypothetical protein